MRGRKKQRHGGPSYYDAMAARPVTTEQVHITRAPFDRAQEAMDRKWGIRRLPGISSPEQAAKFGQVCRELEAASDADDIDMVRQLTARLVNGLAHMDAEATAAGHQPATGDVWEFEVDGFRFGILRDGCEWQTAKEQRPDLQIFTGREIGVMLQAARVNHPMIEAAKKIGGAEIVKFKPKLDAAYFDNGGDDIPF